MDEQRKTPEASTEDAARVPCEPLLGCARGMETDHIRQDGTVDDQHIETYYCPPEDIETVDEGHYLRVFVDGPGYNIETRLPYEWLIAEGWTPPGTSAT